VFGCTQYLPGILENVAPRPHHIATGTQKGPASPGCGALRAVRV